MADDISKLFKLNAPFKCERQVVAYFQGYNGKNYLAFWGRLPNNAFLQNEDHRQYPLKSLNNNYIQFENIIQTKNETGKVYRFDKNFPDLQQGMSPYDALKKTKMSYKMITDDKNISQDITAVGYGGTLRAYPLQQFEKISDVQKKQQHQINQYYKQNTNLQYNNIGGIHQFKNEQSPDSDLKLYLYPFRKINEEKSLTQNQLQYIKSMADIVDSKYNQNIDQITKVLTPPVSTHSTYSLVFCQSQDVIDMPITYNIIGQDGEDVIVQIFDLLGNKIIPVSIMSITKNPTNLNSNSSGIINSSGLKVNNNLFKHFHHDQETSRFCACFPNNGKVSRYFNYKFDYDADIVSKTTNLSQVSNDSISFNGNQYMSKFSFDKGTIVLSKDAMICKKLFLCGGIIKKLNFKQIVQVHTKLSNDKIRLFKQYIWNEENKCGDSYNCIRPQTKVQAFNFSFEKDLLGRFQWRFSQVFSDAIMILDRFNHFSKDDDSIVKSSGSQFIPLFWAADKRGIILIGAKTQDKGITFKIESQIVLSKSAIDDTNNHYNSQWFNGYLSFAGLQEKTLQQKIGISEINMEKDNSRSRQDILQSLKNISSGLLFDVCQNTNSALIDHYKIPYYRPFAKAIGYLKDSGLKQQYRKIGISALDLLSFNTFGGKTFQNNYDKNLDLSESKFAISGMTGSATGKEDLNADFRRFQSYICGQFRRNTIRHVGKMQSGLSNRFTDNRIDQMKKLQDQIKKNQIELSIGDEALSQIQYFSDGQSFPGGVYNIQYVQGALHWRSQHPNGYSFHSRNNKQGDMARIVAAFRGNTLSQQFDSIAPVDGIFSTVYKTKQQAQFAFKRNTKKFNFVHFGGKIGIKILHKQNKQLEVDGSILFRLNLIKAAAFHHQFTSDNNLVGIKHNVLMPAVSTHGDIKIFGPSSRIFLQTFSCDRQNSGGFKFATQKLIALNLYTNSPIEFFGFDSSRSGENTVQVSKTSIQGQQPQCIQKLDQISIARNSKFADHIAIMPQFQYSDYFTMSPICFHLLSQEKQKQFTPKGISRDQQINLIKDFLVPKNGNQKHFYLNYVVCDSNHLSIMGLVDHIKDSLNKTLQSVNNQCIVYQCAGVQYTLCEKGPLSIANVPFGCTCKNIIKQSVDFTQYGQCFNNYNRCIGASFIDLDVASQYNYYSCDGTTLIGGYNEIRSLLSIQNINVTGNPISILLDRMSCNIIKNNKCQCNNSSSTSESSSSNVKSSSSSSGSAHDSIVTCKPSFRNDQIQGQDAYYKYGRIFNFNPNLQLSKFSGMQFNKNKVNFPINDDQFNDIFKSKKTLSQLKVDNLQTQRLKYVNNLFTTNVSCEDTSIYASKQCYICDYDTMQKAVPTGEDPNAKINNDQQIASKMQGGKVFASHIVFKKSERQTYVKVTIVIVGLGCRINVISGIWLGKQQFILDVRYSQLQKILIVQQIGQINEIPQVDLYYIDQGQFYDGIRFSGNINTCKGLE